MDAARMVIITRKEEWRGESEERKEGRNEKEEIEKRYLGAAGESTRKKKLSCNATRSGKGKTFHWSYNNGGHISLVGYIFSGSCCSRGPARPILATLSSNTRIVEALEAPP